MRMHTKVVTTTVAVLTIGLVLAACGSTGSNAGNSGGSAGAADHSSTADGVTADTINYGMIYDQTGPTSVSQQPWANGVLTQIKKANDAGGINGRKIVVNQADDKSDVTTGTVAYKKMVTQAPVVGITGINHSSIQEAVMPLIRADKMPLVGPQATTKAGLVPFNDTAFFVIPSYADQVDVMLGYMMARLGQPRPKVAIFRIVASSGIEVSDLATAAVKKAGGSIVSDQVVPGTATTTDAQIQNILSAKPDFIIFHTSPTLSLLGLKSMEKLNARIPVISTPTGGGPVGYKGVSAATGDLMQYTTAYTPADVIEPGTAAMVADAAKYGYSKDTANTLYVTGYIAGAVLVRGLTDAGKNLTRASFVTALAAIKDMATGGITAPITFGPKNRSGLSSTEPVKYNYTTGKFEGVGTFADYDKYVTHEYSSR